MLKFLPTLGFWRALGLFAMLTTSACGSSAGGGPPEAESSSAIRADERFHAMLLEAYASAGPTKLREELSFNACFSTAPEARVFLWNAPEGQWFGAALRGDLARRNIREELTVVHTPSSLSPIRGTSLDITFVGTPATGPASTEFADAGDAGAPETCDSPLGPRVILLRCSGVAPDGLISPDSCK